jgi:hypothetical protein
MPSIIHMVNECAKWQAEQVDNDAADWAVVPKKSGT